ncbi:hypothetical protein RUND412_002676 [Rhizina undulata]
MNRDRQSKASSFFGGRGKFHSKDCYNIGPYQSIKDYVIACYDKEIYYYTHAAESDIKQDLFENTSLPDFVQTLQATRQLLLDDDSNFQPEEPFVLNHEFAGAYPLSELLSVEGVDIIECVDAPSMKENSKWCDRILDHVKDSVSKRGWNEEVIKLLLEGNNEVLQRARCEIFPEDL